MSSINVGIIGAGMVCQLAHLPAFSRLTNAKLIALADHNSSQACSIASRFGIAKVYFSHHDLLADPDVQAVVIVVHRHKAPAIIRDALQAGKHVLTEKPMAFDSLIAQELVEIAKKAQRIFAIGFMKRHDIGVCKAKNLLAVAQENNFGKILSARFRNYCGDYVGYCDDYIQSPIKNKRTEYITPLWLPIDMQPKYDWFMNVASHTINLIQYFFGEHLQIKYADFSGFLTAVSILNAEDIPIIMDVGKASTGRWEETVEIYFENGRMELELSCLKQRDRSAILTIDHKTDVYTRRIEIPAGPWAFDLQAKNFIDTIQKKDILLTTPECGLRSIEIIEKLWKHHIALAF